MNTHALGILEFPRLMAHVAGRANSAPGAAAVRALAPRTDRLWIEAEHARVGAMRSLVSSELGWPSEPIPELGEALRRLRIEGLTWTAVELLHAATLLRSSRRTRDALRDPRRPPVVVAFLSHAMSGLVDLRGVEETIDRALADDGSVRDEASPALRAVRRELRKTEGELVRMLEREIARLEAHHQVSDASVTMRNGRWVMPVRRGARVLVGGIVHDSSGTGETIFVEPPAAVEFGNRVRELENDEQREVERVLRELTESLRPYHAQITAAFESLVMLDSLAARARYAIEAACAPLAFCEPSEGLAIVDGRHPLLLARGHPVVPFDLTLEAGERTLLVSGPNTGGKTVLLKAIGLLGAMAQSGVPAPVGATSRLPVFDDMFADVGDEQSIEASLSTFSAHVKNLGEILRLATPNSLVLVDELGSGTDPAEGAALGGSILETLTRRNSMTVATTHLGQLKLLATEVEGVVNASLQFDAVQLAPTYRLLKGVPGRSYGISIARRLQLPDDVLERAEQRLPAGERDLAVLLADIEAREALLAERERLMAMEAAKTRSRIATVADREAKVRDREREAEKVARQEARKYLLEARGELERAIAEVRAQATANASASASAQRAQSAEAGGLDETARAARRSLEDAAAAQGAALERAAQHAVRDRERRAGKGIEAAAAPEAVSGAGAAGGARTAPLAEGDSVLVGTLGNKAGRIISVRGAEARVAVGSLTLSVPVNSLTRTAAPPPPAVRVTLSGNIPDAEPVREVDIRGLRGDEIDDRVLQALDAAIRADLREVRIIHGKGTGALRARVGEMLKKDTRVAGFRLGAWNEGGAGVTVAELS
jgi:DNA mismatch repair protein MutS2